MMRNDAKVREMKALVGYRGWERAGWVLACVLVCECVRVCASEEVGGRI
jgi:hypothetical protein